jgi:xanthine dehydrogenase accessory factor
MRSKGPRGADFKARVGQGVKPAAAAERGFAAALVRLRVQDPGRYNALPVLSGAPVKHWLETAEILDQLAKLVVGEGCAALATVVRISGSAYRRPGAKLLIEASGLTQGGVSGGCLESDVRARGLEVLRGSPSRMLHYDTGSDEETLWGLGLGCEGALDVYLQRIDAAWMEGAGKQMRELFNASIAFAPITVVSGPLAGRTFVLAKGTLSGTSGSQDTDRELGHRASLLLEGDGGGEMVELGGQSAFVDVLRPPPRLFIFGAGDDARPLAALAAQAGFEVMVVDHRPAYLTPERFPPPLRLALRRPSDGAANLPLTLSRRNFAVVQTHALSHDRDWVLALAAQPLAYLGLLGPRARKEQVFRDVSLDGAKVFGPIGIDIGADGPEQVAVSIVAELLAVNARREGGHLRARAGGIHDR